MNVVQLKAIEKLKELKPFICGSESKARADFAAIAYLGNLHMSIITHQLNEYGISGSDFNACLHGEDRKYVIHNLVKRSFENNKLSKAIQRNDRRIWRQWLDIYYEVESYGSGMLTERNCG